MPIIKKIKPEAAVQAAFIQWFSLQYPHYKNFIIKISNENAFRGNAFKMGLHTGAADLFIAVPTTENHGFWLEIKAENFRVTKSNQRHIDNQMFFLQRMALAGYAGAICVGLEECMNAVKFYLRHGVSFVH